MRLYYTRKRVIYFLIVDFGCSSLSLSTLVYFVVVVDVVVVFLRRTSERECTSRTKGYRRHPIQQRRQLRCGEVLGGNQVYLQERERGE